MKKFISGIIVGGMLFAGASVFADGDSLIGKKVQGLYSVEKNGNKVADAVVIDGTAYAPVRAVSDATGAGLSVEGKRIIIQDKEVQPIVSSTISASEQRKKDKIFSLKNGIAICQENISKFESLLKIEKEKLEADSSDGKVSAMENIQELEIRIKQEQDSIAAAEAQLADLQKE